MADEKAVNPRAGVPTMGRIDVYRVDPDNLIMDPDMDGRIDHDDLWDLMASIQQIGQIQPIAARKTSDGKLHVIAGFRRTKAIQKLKEANPDASWSVLVRVMPATNDAKGFAITLAENIVRNNLSPLEMASGVGRLRSVFNRTVTEVAQDLGRSDQWVYHMEKILSLPETLQQRIHAREVSVDAAFLLADDPNHVEVVEKVLKDKKAVIADKKKPAAKKGKDGKPASEKKAKVTKKDVAQAKAKDKTSKLVPPTMGGLKKVLNAADALGYVPVAQLLKFISGAMSAEDFSALVVLIED